MKITSAWYGLPTLPSSRKRLFKTIFFFLQISSIIIDMIFWWKSWFNTSPLKKKHVLKCAYVRVTLYVSLVFLSVSLCVSVGSSNSTCVLVYLCVSLCVFVSVGVSVCFCLNMRVSLHAWVSPCVSLDGFLCFSACPCVYICLLRCICVFPYVCLPARVYHCMLECLAARLCVCFSAGVCVYFCSVNEKHG